MSNAGSALMGIGRASGDNRAVEAAQQAVESPLLEVSIDGARGVLFNVIGGQDMSMHEINTVAETITASADKNANIIFGATINPELEGELIVTVVATGFEDSYFSKQTSAHLKGLIKEEQKKDNSEESPAPEDKKNDFKVTTTEVPEDINMDLEDTKSTDSHTDFHSEEHKDPDIWNSDSGKTDESGNDDNKDKFVSQSYDDEELEKPSFLRRLKKLGGNKDDKSDDSDNV